MIAIQKENQTLQEQLKTCQSKLGISKWKTAIFNGDEDGKFQTPKRNPKDEGFETLGLPQNSFFNKLKKETHDNKQKPRRSPLRIIAGGEKSDQKIPTSAKSSPKNETNSRNASKEMAGKNENFMKELKYFFEIKEVKHFV
jgi:hypothetical protein